MDHVQHDHAFLGLDLVVLEAAAGGVAAEHAHRELRHRYFLSWKSARSSAGISGKGSRASARAPCRWRMTTLILPHESSVYGWSSRVWPPRLSRRSSAASVQHSATVRSDARSSAMCQPGLYVRPPSMCVRAARCLNDSIRLSASRSSCSVRISPTRLCIVSWRSAWIAYGFSPPLRVNGSSISFAYDSTWPESTVSCPPKSLA